MQADGLIGGEPPVVSRRYRTRYPGKSGAMLSFLALQTALFPFPSFAPLYASFPFQAINETFTTFCRSDANSKASIASGKVNWALRIGSTLTRPLISAWTAH